jgi:hypothetical protein
MIKKIILIFICLTFLFSCGKKEDPEYKARKNSVINYNV